MRPGGFPWDSYTGCRPKPRVMRSGYGYPELRLLPEAVGTRSGLSMAPYIREARRIIGLRRVLEQDISADREGRPRPGSFP